MIWIRDKRKLTRTCKIQGGASIIPLQIPSDGHAIRINIAWYLINIKKQNSRELQNYEDCKVIPTLWFHRGTLQIDDLKFGGIHSIYWGSFLLRKFPICSFAYWYDIPPLNKNEAARHLPCAKSAWHIILYGLNNCFVKCVNVKLSGFWQDC